MEQEAPNLSTEPEGNFKVVKKIGEGTYGTVWHCKDRILEDKNFVIKVVDISQGIEYFRSEFLYLKTMSHPTIIDCYKYEKKGMLGYIYMEYASGGTLYDYHRLHGRSLEESNAMFIFAQILLGVHHMHDQNLIHRDLKPKNILMSCPDKSLIKIADFGITKCLDNGIPTDYCGTEKYMAPEVLISKKYNEKKSDVWSIGMILYELLNDFVLAKIPVNKFISNPLDENVLDDLRPEFFHPNTRRIVHCMLHKDPKRRVSTDILVKLPEMNEHISKYYSCLTSADRQKITSYLLNRNRC